MGYYNKHYICLDKNNNIIKGFSDAFEQPQDNDICISERNGRHFELLGQINPSLLNIQGIYLYRYIDGSAVAKTPEEIQTEIAALPKPVSTPTIEERQATLERAFMELAGEIYG